MITVLKNLQAIAPSIETMFSNTGAVGAVTYSVVAGGAGGTINALTGLYTAPQLSSYDPKKFVDTIQVEDSEGTIGTTTIMVLPYIGLLANIIQVEMGLNQDQVQLYQQKFKVPNDNSIHIAVGMLTQKPTGSKREYVQGASLKEIVSTYWKCVAWVEIYSASNLAFLRKEEIASAIHSTYSEQIQEANNFKIAKIPSQFTNISSEQGPGIPYRFNVSVQMTFTTSKEKEVPYYETFEEMQTNVDD